MRMRGRGQAPASFLLGPLHEVRGSSRVEAWVVACSAVARCVDGATAGSLCGCTGGARGARGPPGSLVSTFGHFLRGTLSSDLLAPLISWASVRSIVRATQLHALEVPKSCFRPPALSQNRPPKPDKPPAPPPCVLRPRAGAGCPPFAPCEASSSAGASPADDA